MDLSRFGPNFKRVFLASLFEQISFALFVHFPGYLADLGVTEGRIGVLFSVSAVIGLASRPLMGRVLDLVHRRTVLLAAGAMEVGLLMAFLTTSTWGPWLWAVFLVYRVIQMSLFTTMLTYGADSLPMATRTQGLALFGLAGLGPIAISGVLGDFVIGISGFDSLFLLAAVMSLASFATVWTLPTLPVRGQQPRRSFWKALTQRNLLPLWFATMLFALGVEALFTFARTYVDERQIGTAGLLFGVYGVTAAATRIAGGRNYDRLPHRPLLVGATIVYGFGLGLLAVASGLVTFVSGAALAGASHGVAFPLLSSEVVNRARVAERGSAMTTFTSIFDVALLLGAPAVGFLIEGFSYTAGFGVTAIVIAAGAGAYTLWDRRLVRSSAPLVAEEVLE
ncbi:MAG: MFS transporter [Acidimicrobiia bacterium]|nr:MFS transporter [Acidimicrobiia bacterium]